MPHLILLAAELYALIGAVTAAWFVLIHIDRIDPASRGAYPFRPLLLPGAMLLWPLILAKR